MEQRRETISKNGYMQPIWEKKLPVLIFIFILGLIFFGIAFPIVSGQGDDDYFKIIEDKYNNLKFRDFDIESPLSDDVVHVKIIFFLDGQETYNETTEVTTDPWKYSLDISKFIAGKYSVSFIALNNNLTKIGKEKTINIEIESPIPPGSAPGSIFTESFTDKYKGKSFTDELKMSLSGLDNVKSIQIEISKDNKEDLPDETTEVTDGEWEFKTNVKDWDKGTYDVVLLAYDQLDEVLDSKSFQIKVDKEKEEEPFYMPLVCAIVLIIFIVLLIILFIFSIIKHKKIMKELRFEPKDVVKKLPMMSIMSMFITLLLVLAGLAVCMTAGLDLIPFILFLVMLGLLMLVTYSTFSNRNYPKFILYLIFGVLTLVVVSLAGLWSESDAIGPVIAAILLASAFVLFFISILMYWLTSRRGFFIALVAVILSLVFFILQIVFIALSALDIMGWWLSAILGSVLLLVLLFIGWIILREDIFFFESRVESKTHRGERKTLNMFDVLSTPRGLLKRDFDRKVMGKVSYEQTHDKKVRMEVIQLREWDTKNGRAHGRRLMGVYVGKMRGKEGPMFNKVKVAESVKYTTYSSDTNLDDKLKLCKAFGFQVKDSGKERGLDYYDLELVHSPFLGLGSPMGSDNKKKNYDKDSGYARDDKDKDKDQDRDHRYDYEYEEEQRKKEKEQEARTGRERESRADHDRGRNRRREREPDEDVEDWGSVDGSRGRERDEPSSRGYRGERVREHESEREPPPEKEKKRPPPPRIVRDK